MKDFGYEDVLWWDVGERYWPLGLFVVSLAATVFLVVWVRSKGDQIILKESTDQNLKALSCAVCSLTATGVGTNYCLIGYSLEINFFRRLSLNMKILINMEEPGKLKSNNNKNTEMITDYLFLERR